MADTYDILVIGAGPGGYVTAIRAAQLGFKTAVVEREHLGGICLNWGCIPTKALLRSAEIFHYMQHAKDYGLSVAGRGFDAGAVVKRSRGVSERLTAASAFLMKKNKIDVIWGEAAIYAARQGHGRRKPRAPQAPEGRARAGHAIKPSTSSSRPARGPRVLPGIEPDRKLIWTYFEAMVPEACRSRCSSWARARSASSSPRSIAPWARR